MIDIHTHLFSERYDADRDEAVRRAREAGVGFMLSVGTSPEDNGKAIAVAEKYENIFASVGLHPHFFNEVAAELQARLKTPDGIRDSSAQKDAIDAVIRELREKARSSDRVRAIGECGLDYFSRVPGSPVTDAQKNLQKEGFEAQIALAQELGLPLIIHTRPSGGSMDAYEDVFAILKSHSSLLPSPVSHSILHCYMGDTEMTERFLTLPFVSFSFTGTITYPVKQSLRGSQDDPRETISRVPLERLFVETDCPYLAPQAKRGERNEPAYVRMTAEAVCAVKGIEMAALETELSLHCREVFGE